MNITIIHSANNGFYPRFYQLQRKAIRDNGDRVTLLEPHNKSNQRTVLSNQIVFGTRLNWFIHFHLYKLTGLQDVWSFFDNY